MNGRVLAYSAEDAYAELRSFLELGETASCSTVIAAVLRRLCSFMCPCPSSAVVRMACRSLDALGLAVDDLAQAVRFVLEDMIVCGDILELAHVATPGAEAHPNWLYCAPPSYVVRTGGNIHVFGIAVDNAAFLPREMRVQLQCDGAVRYLRASHDGTLALQLSRLGLREVKQDAWMIAVTREPAQTFIDRYRKRLANLGVPGDLPELRLLLPRVETSIPYSARWKLATSETGLFIGRSPQPYGAPLWYLCELDNGAVQRSLLLPLTESTERASDAAWRLQLALDASASRPATFIARKCAGEYKLFFDFPLPVAARRRLLHLGASSTEAHSPPFKFTLPIAEFEAERTFLRDHYWFDCKAEDAQ